MIPSRFLLLLLLSLISKISVEYRVEILVSILKLVTVVLHHSKIKTDRSTFVTFVTFVIIFSVKNRMGGGIQIVPMLRK